MTQFYSIGTPDLPAPFEADLLRERQPPQTGPFRFRPTYTDLVCRKCNRVDELTALTRGVSQDFLIPPLRCDAMTTFDHFLIVTRRMRDALLSVAGLDVYSFAVPSSPDHVVLFPKQQFVPPPDARVYTPMEPPRQGDAFQVRGRSCRKCGRIRSMTFWVHWLEVPPDVVLAGAMIEIGNPGVSVAWIASQTVVDVIRTGGFTGWSIRPTDAFKNQRWPHP